MVLDIVKNVPVIFRRLSYACLPPFWYATTQSWKGILC